MKYTFKAANRRQGMTLADLRAVGRNVPEADGKVRVVVGFRGQIQEVEVDVDTTASVRDAIQTYLNTPEVPGCPA